MNVAFPGEASPEAFWIIRGSMALILAVMVAFFRRRLLALAASQVPMGCQTVLISTNSPIR